MRGTYDRAGGNDVADASHFLHQLADDYNVTLDVEGAGILYFVRTNHWHGSPWHYTVDGYDHLVEETSTADPLHPAADSKLLPQEAFPTPVTMTWAQTKGADLSWVPVGFLSGCHSPLPPGTDNSAPDAAISDLLSQAGSDIAPATGTSDVSDASGHLDLAAGHTALLWTGRGPSMLRALEFSVPRTQALQFSRLRLRITWDWRAMPSIDAPIAFFWRRGALQPR